ncbi:MAG: protein translocase subunit SecF, partial [Candidatus Brennerbacteria bacterium CG11_big_fil_rev_8_21_14_0_20_43_10]
QWFIMALMIGISTGMYSSIFIASTLLVDVWKWQQRRNN